MSCDEPNGQQLEGDARPLGGHETKTDAVTAALRHYLQRYRQAEVIELFEAVPYEPAYDYKAERQRGQS